MIFHLGRCHQLMSIERWHNQTLCIVTMWKEKNNTCHQLVHIYWYIYIYTDSCNTFPWSERNSFPPLGQNNKLTLRNKVPPPVTDYEWGEITPRAVGWNNPSCPFVRPFSGGLSITPIVTIGLGPTLNQKKTSKRCLWRGYSPNTDEALVFLWKFVFSQTWPQNRIHGTDRFTYMYLIKIKQSWIVKYAIVPWILWEGIKGFKLCFSFFFGWGKGGISWYLFMLLCKNFPAE